MNNVSLANFRNRLDPNHALHPGYVLGVFMTRIPVSAFLSPDGSVLPLDKDMLLRVAEIAKGQYQAHKGLPAGLSSMPQVGEIYASVTIPAASANMYVAEHTNSRCLLMSYQAAAQPVLLILERRQRRKLLESHLCG